MRLSAIDLLIRAALCEDVGRGDVTSRSVIPARRRSQARVIAKAPGVVAGAAVAARVFHIVDRAIACRIQRRDGQAVRRGQTILRVSGPARSILTAERTALNLLGHLSGVASLTAQFVRRVRPYPVKILDTRKTLPGLRALQKQAVRAGGGHNHRMGLDDAVLIKTNHLIVLRAATSDKRQVTSEELISTAVSRARRARPRAWIEIEVRNVSELKAALRARPDAILLDNWRVGRLRTAVALRNSSPVTRSRRPRSPYAAHRTPLLEVSGGVTLENVRRIAAAGVDRISIGRLTHSAPALDVSLRMIRHQG